MGLELAMSEGKESVPLDQARLPASGGYFVATFLGEDEKNEHIPWYFWSYTCAKRSKEIWHWQER